MEDLKQSREEINKIDFQMAELFYKRMKAVTDVAAFKREHGMPVFDPTRETEVIARCSAYVDDPELQSYYVNFLKYNMELSKQYQHRLLEGMRVAYCGVRGAFAHIATEKIFPDAVFVSFPDFVSAYRSVENGECDCAVLPIENSFAGDVTIVMDIAFSGSLYINGIYDMDVVHHLLGVPGSEKKSIKTVISHPQAIQQCAPYLKEHGFMIEEASNTAIAAKELAQSGKTDTAVIASARTAAIYGLEVLERKINESNTNTTRFAVFSRVANKPADSDGQFAMFFTVDNSAGSLSKAISAIGKFGFNLRTLKSHPTKDSNWAYYFFAEGNGNIGNENGKMMLEELSKACSSCRVIGVFDGEKKLIGD